jgi:hypothetical protein
MDERAKRVTEQLLDHSLEVMHSTGDREGAERCQELVELVRATPATDERFSRLRLPSAGTDDHAPWGYALDAVTEGAHDERPLDQWLVEVVKAMELDRQMELLSRCCGRLCIDCVLREPTERDQQRGPPGRGIG